MYMGLKEKKKPWAMREKLCWGKGKKATTSLLRYLVLGGEAINTNAGPKTNLFGKMGKKGGLSEGAGADIWKKRVGGNDLYKQKERMRDRDQPTTSPWHKKNQ